MSNSGEDVNSYIERFLGDVSKQSATKQIIIGATSGWITGFLAMKVGKVMACAVGGGIILLEVCHLKGYININYDKINKEADKVTDKVQKAVTGQGPTWTDKVERFVDRKLDKAEGEINKRKTKAKAWFSGTANRNMKQMQIFLASFAAGMAIGVVTS